MNAVAANAALHPAITPLEFMLGMMTDPNVDPALRFKAAQAAAPFVHPKPTAAPPGDSGATIIDGHRSAEETALVAEAERQSDLQSRQELAELLDQDDPLSAEERAELAALDAKGDLFAALPQHLRPIRAESAQFDPYPAFVK